MEFTAEEIAEAQAAFDRSMAAYQRRTLASFDLDLAGAALRAQEARS